VGVTRRLNTAVFLPTCGHVIEPGGKLRLATGQKGVYCPVCDRVSARVLPWTKALEHTIQEQARVRAERDKQP
jgi:hypothetical protein